MENSEGKADGKASTEADGKASTETGRADRGKQDVGRGGGRRMGFERERKGVRMKHAACEEEL